MVNLDEPTNIPLGGDQLTVSDQAKRFLSEAGKWGRFISIIGFIMIALMVIFSLFAGVMFGNLPGLDELPFPSAIFSLVYLLIAALYFFPVFYLYRFSYRIREALNRNDEAILESSFENLKSHYKFIGILLIVMLALYALIFVFAVIGGLLAL
jgi:magnesium-transporting ATPase (P-type)